MTNSFILIAGLISLGFIALIWMRVQLVSQLSQCTHKQQILENDLRKRRDTIPVLLEVVRRHEHPNEHWQILLNKRADFHDAQPLSREWDLEKLLMDYVDTLRLNTADFLEIKKDLLRQGEVVQAEFEELQEMIAGYNDTQKRFPYSIASAIFGLKELSL